MIFLSGPWIWCVFLAVAVLGLVQRRITFWLLSYYLMALGFQDFIFGTLVKPWIGRLRPCRALTDIAVLDGCAGWYGFPSNHALNAMFVAAIISGFVTPRWLKGCFIGLAIMIGFSRIYVGAHYFSDVLVGFTIGAAWAVGSKAAANKQPWLRSLHTSQN